MADVGNIIPEITDADIEWVEEVMGLTELDEPRRNFLKRCTSVDVSACPGSGKTTLVVAKLAILARKWPHRTKGICVLSHTNVAREEIQQRLSGIAVGQSLLAYPHFIGTIHVFANRFLALPWLRSNGYPSPTVDNDVTIAYRRNALSAKEYRAVQSFLEKKFSGFDRLRICAPDLSFDLGGKEFPAKPTAPTYGHAQKAIEAAAKDGYFCHDEMFIWAKALLDDYPDICSSLRCRFPLALIDEMQDTSSDQGEILHRVFPRDSEQVVVQRIGDENQAIFDSPKQEADEHSPFPATAAEQCLEISNSFRFGPEIAALAAPFAVVSVDEGLNGIGPKRSGEIGNCTHSIFVFPDSKPEGVLSAFGDHVLATFTDEFLKGGPVVAVGGLHKLIVPELNKNEKKYPQSVPHYWQAYRPDRTRRNAHPKSLVEYFRIAQQGILAGSELAPSVERVAMGITRCASMVGDVGRVGKRARTHRSLLEALQGQEALILYTTLLKDLLIDRRAITQEFWAATKPSVMAIATSLSEGDTNSNAAATFLAWCDNDETADSSTLGNVYRVGSEARSLNIRVGSIHSVKGQTHLATLLLCTYWHDRWSERMLPWLLGSKSNKSDAKTRDSKRLLQTYVAMTRPTHLLCLAIPRSTLGTGDAFSNHKGILEGKGWRVVELDNN